MHSPNLAGCVFNRLTVIEKTSQRKYGKVLWKCICSCGKEKLVNTSQLLNGSIKSCGCMHNEIMQNMINVGKNNKKHGQSFSRIYNIWAGMKSRCSNPKTKFYHRYGGRGITVCVKWANSFEIFKDWALKHGYAENLSLDRIDNDGKYSPDNCRWVTQREQANNKECTYHYQGKSLADWAKELNIKHRTLRGRLERGWSWEETVTTPLIPNMDKMRKVKKNKALQTSV